jgi:hypothetical protein
MVLQQNEQKMKELKGEPLSVLSTQFLVKKHCLYEV